MPGQDFTAQELIALGLVAMVVAIALWRRLRKKPSGCDSCSGNPANKTGEHESVVRFHKTPPR